MNLCYWLLAAVIMIAIIVKLSYRRTAFPIGHMNHQGSVIGIDEETLVSFPNMLYSEKIRRSFKSTERKESEEKKCCTICLSDYKEWEVVRVIPNCSHMFHMDCIDQWLRRQATCPVCRTSTLPTLRSTPALAQEAPPSTVLTVLDHEPIRPLRG